MSFLNPLKNPLAWIAGLPITAFIGSAAGDLYGRTAGLM